MARASWLADTFAVAMIVIAFSCAGRLVLSRLRRRATELDADGLHVAMGTAMAGMLVPRLSPLPSSVWEIVFGIAAAWFGWQAARASRSRAEGMRCRHPLPHLVECAAMLYMLLAGAGSRLSSPGSGVPMPGMAGTTVGFPAIALVLALFMLGHVVWSADRLTSQTRARTAASGSAGAWQRQLAGGPVLAPRLAGCLKIAMGVTMGYMLIVML